MNAIPSLGTSVLRCNGEPFLPNASADPMLELQVVRVSLVRSDVISITNAECDGPVTSMEASIRPNQRSTRMQSTCVEWWRFTIHCQLMPINSHGSRDLEADVS